MPNDDVRILVGVDLLVQGHDWLLDRAARFATVLDGMIDLVFVTQHPSKEHTALLNGLLTLLPEERRGRARVEQGDAAETLIELTGQYTALVVGPREPAMVMRWLNGPMAVRVLHRSVCPILVPRGDRPPTPRPRMLCGVDVSGEAIDAVLDFAASWAQRLEGTIDGVYALPATLPPIANKAVREEAEKQWMASKEPIRRQLAQKLERIPAEHRGEALLRAGEPEDVLLHMSADYDVLLVGNRGRSGLSRLILGNVAHRVVRNADCDVLVLPTAAMFDKPA